MSENSIEFSLSNSEQRDSWLNSGHRTLDADNICPNHYLSINRECYISHDDLKGCPIAISFLSIYSYAYLDISHLWRYSFSSS